MLLGIATGFGNPKGTWGRYRDACEHRQIPYRIVDLVSKDWLDNVKQNMGEIDGLLVGPPCQNIEEYAIYMERIGFIYEELKIPIYPSYQELKLYENKRYCTTWLKHNQFLIPETYVFADKKEALNYLDHADYPLVVKSTIGAGASTVKIVHYKLKAKLIAHMAFGVHRLLSFGYTSWIKHKTFPIYIPLIGSSMKHYMIVQNFIPIKWEWRIIKIGESYFGHQKLLRGQYASGSDKVGWVDPPKVLFDMIRDVCNRGGFYSMSMDVFESVTGEYYINELQSMFGSYNNSQMYINGKPGRYIVVDGVYEFQDGYFNLFGSCLLRVDHFVRILTSSEYGL